MSTEPRIPPLEPGEASPEVAEILERPGAIGGSLARHNIFRTFARHPDLFRSWLRLGGYLLRSGVLPPRDRELMILRTAVRCRSSYEWGQHVRIALEAGIDRDTIERVAGDPGLGGWDEHEATLLRAVDELHDTATLSDRTWAALARRYDERQLIETTMLIGHYHLVAFTLNTLRVPLDEGLDPLPGED